MDDLIGKTIGKYTIEGVLGEGGMGSVYLARHNVLEHQVAIKVLRNELCARPKLVQRFFLEAKTVAKLRDPGVAQLHDYGHTDAGQAYIVMEYLEGETLAARMRRQQKLEPVAALRLARAVARTMAVVHASKMVHRDLKPDNIFIVQGGSSGSSEQIKILDFGIAKLSPLNRDNPELTMESDVLGTPLYMAPEQWHGASKVDGRADIYSLGCIVYRLLCGEPPFSGGTVGHLCKAHLVDIPPPLAEREPSLSPQLAELIMSCLHKDREQRPATMQQFADLLGQVLKREIERTLPASPGEVSTILVALDLAKEFGSRGAPARIREHTLKLPNKEPAVPEAASAAAVSEAALSGGAPRAFASRGQRAQLPDSLLHSPVPRDTQQLVSAVAPAAAALPFEPAAPAREVRDAQQLQPPRLSQRDSFAGDISRTSELPEWSAGLASAASGRFNPVTTTAGASSEVLALPLLTRSVSLHRYGIAAAAALLLLAVIGVAWLGVRAGSGETSASRAAAAAPPPEREGDEPAAAAVAPNESSTEAAEPDPAAAAPSATASAEVASEDAALADSVAAKDASASASAANGRGPLNARNNMPPSASHHLKNTLYRKALAGKATDSELMLLEKICREEGDHRCAAYPRSILTQRARDRVPRERRNSPVDIY